MRAVRLEQAQIYWEMKPQKFKRGDVVHIAKNLGPSMWHFENDCDAIIMASYRDLYGGDDINNWKVMFCDTGGECAWYYTNQLTFLRHGGEAEIEKVTFLREKREATEQDIDWILANWIHIRERTPGATIGKLMALVGITDPSGPSGEGFVWYANAMATRKLLDRVLSTGDRGKLDEFLAQLKATEKL